MSVTNQLERKLTPAKPYAGVPQHQAVRSAIAKLGYEVLATGRRVEYGAVAVRVSTATHFVRAGLPRAGVARFEVEAYDDPWGRDQERVAELAQRVTSVETHIVSRLRDAGWTVELYSTSARREWHVFGPGAIEWAEQQGIAKREAEVRAMAARARADEQRAELVGLLARHGVLVNDYEVLNGKIALTLAQVRTLVGEV